MALTHFSGGLRIASGLNVTGAAALGSLTLTTQLAGAQLAAGGVTGRILGAGAVTARAFATGSAGPLFAMPLRYKVGALAAASGTIVTGWRVGFGHNAVIRGFHLSLFTGIRGGSFGIKVWQRTAGVGTLYTAKSAFGTSIGATAITAVTRLGAAVTVGARASVGISINKVGSTTAGSGAGLTLFYTYN